MDKLDELRSIPDAQGSAVPDNCNARVALAPEMGAWQPDAGDTPAASISNEALRGQVWAASHGKTIRIATWVVVAILAAIYFGRKWL